MPEFSTFACIDWSGARGEHLPGIAVAIAQGDDAPVLVAPPAPATSWSRAAALDWLEVQIAARLDMLIGLDLSPNFPFLDRGAYFPEWADSPADLPGLWALVERLCADEPHLGANSFLTHDEGQRHFRHSARHVGDLFGSGIGRLREVERHQRATKQANSWSCFNLVGAGQVGKSSLTGMRMLHRLRQAGGNEPNKPLPLAGGVGVGLSGEHRSIGTAPPPAPPASGRGDVRLPLWPFDPLPSHGPLLVEIYTSMAARAAGLPKNRSKMRDGAALDAALSALGSRPTGHIGPLSDHASDALLTAAWLRATAHRADFWSPALLTDQIARTEGWTFGVV